MRRLLLILLATAPLTGCQFLSQGDDIEIITPTEITNAGEAIVAEALNGDEPAEAVDFADPTVDAVPTPVVTADLIRSTDPAARAQQVNRSRPDPFAALPIPLLAPQAVELPAAAAGGSSGAAAAATPTRPEPTPPPVRAQAPNTPLVRPTPIAALPSVPRPVIAPTISVSGIIQLGGEPYAIVSAGSEPERYVRVGDRIAGGSVRVKRIDTLAFEPQVILEENGIEVSRPVGDAATAAEAGPVAAVPVPAAPAPATQTSAPGLPPIVPMSSSTLLPPQGSSPQSELPGSLLLSPAETTTQAVLPNMRIEVLGAV